MKPYYEDEKAVLYHGDCREVLSGGLRAEVHLVVTSPPYFNARSYSFWSDYAHYLAFLGEVVAGVTKVLSAGRMACYNTSAVIEPRPSRSTRSTRRNIPADLHAIATDFGYWFQEEIVWVKPEGAAVNRNQRFSLDRHPLQWRANACTERIGVYQKPASFLNDRIIAEYGGRDRVLGDYDRSEVWQINPAPSKDHPAAFPLAIPERLTRYYSWTGDTVVDPFAGTGTTLIAATRMGRKAIGIEAEERYCEAAARRLEAEPLSLEIA